jgi:signal transduction histidine kinase
MNSKEKSKEKLLADLGDLRKKLSEREVSKKLQERLSGSASEKIKESILSVIENFPEPITVINIAHKIIWMNRQAREFLFGSPSPQKFLFCYQCHHRKQTSCDGVEYDCAFDRVRRSRTLLTLVHEHYRWDGEKRLIEITAAPLLSEEGFFQGIVEIAHDITEHRKADEDRERLINELKKSLLEIHVLRGMIPACAWCGRVRDDQGVWKKIEDYVTEHSHAKFTHGICPECLEEVETNEK